METDLYSLFRFKKSIALFACCVMLFSCINDPEQVKYVKSDKSVPVEWAQDVKMIYSEWGAVKATMKAPKLEKYYDGHQEYTIMPKGINAVFYDSAMNERSGIDAGYAIEYPQKGIVEARNNVRVINEVGDTLYTEYLVWDRNEKKIHTNTSVRIITHENEVIYGENGMEADEQFRRWRILSVKESTIIIRDVDD